MRQICRATALLGLATALMASVGLSCATDRVEGGSPTPSTVATAAPPAGAAFRLHADDAARCRFPVPLADYQVEARHFDAQLPPSKIRHQLTVSSQGHAVVRVDVWDDPERRALPQWVEQNLRYLLELAEQPQARAMTPERVEGWLLEQPRSPQAFARATALLATGGRVFRVTCLDADDDRARLVFERLIDGLEPEVPP